MLKFGPGLCLSLGWFVLKSGPGLCLSLGLGLA